MTKITHRGQPLKSISLYIRDYSHSYSIREMTLLLKTNYSHTFKRVNELIKKDILVKNKRGQANNITFNIRNVEAVKLLSFVEETQEIENLTLKIIIKEAIKIDSFSCIGLFGSRVSKKAKKDSDWDVFIVTTKNKEMDKISNKFPYAKKIHLEIFSMDEFYDNLIANEDNVVKHIVRNKQIIFNPHPFYNIINKWEVIRYAPTQ